MNILSPILELINGIKIVCVNFILGVSLCGKVIISIFEVIFEYASLLVHGLGVVFEDFQHFTLEQVFLLGKLKTLIDNIFHGILKLIGDLGNGIIEFLFHGKVQTKAIISTMEQGIINFFSLLSKALIWISETLVELVLFFPRTAYKLLLKAGEIVHYSSVKFTEFAVHIVKTVLRDIVSYSLAMIAIFLFLKFRRQIIRFGIGLLYKSFRMLLSIPRYLRLPQRSRRPQQSPIRLRPRPPLPISPKKTALDVSAICVICQDQPKCVVLLPCKHLCLCKDCNDNYFNGFCPLCRTNIQKKLIVFI